MPYLYGGNVLKAHVHRWSEDLPEHAGVLVFDDSDNCLGFGVTSRSSAEAKKLDPTGIVVFRQADVGEYLREVSRARLKWTLRNIQLISNRRTHCSRPKQLRNTGSCMFTSSNWAFWSFIWSAWSYKSSLYLLCLNAVFTGSNVMNWRQSFLFSDTLDM
jgi:hypothetical protein